VPALKVEASGAAAAANGAAAPRKILFVHSSDDLYGADLILLDLVRRLDKQKFEPIVALPTDVPGDGSLTRSLRKEGIRTLGLNMGILRRRFYSLAGVPLFVSRLLYSGWQLVRLIQRESISLVHSHTSAVLPGALAARVTGRPHVWQSLEIIVKPRLVWKATAWLMPRLSERVVSASLTTLEHLCLGDPLNREKGAVFHYGLDSDRIGAGQGTGGEVRKKWGVAPDQAVVGMVARLSEWKGQDHFLNVAARVAKTHPQARFVVVGGTFDPSDRLPEELKRMAAELGIADRVRFDGFRSDIPAVLDALDIFVMPSTLPDPFPTAVLEAMAAGKPVVANAHGGSLEMVVDGVTGFLVPPEQPDAMAAAVRRLLDDPSERLRLGESAQARLLSHFTVDRYVRNWTELYSSVLAQRS